MAVELLREVVAYLSRADVTLTAAERLALLAIADRARANTREAWSGGPDDWQLDRIVGTSMRRVAQRLADSGLEIRVPRGVDSRGRAVYGHRGAQVTYRLPLLLEKGDPTGPPSETRKGGPTGPAIGKERWPSRVRRWPSRVRRWPSRVRRWPSRYTKVAPQGHPNSSVRSVRDPDGRGRSAARAKSARRNPRRSTPNRRRRTRRNPRHPRPIPTRRTHPMENHPAPRTQPHLRPRPRRDNHSRTRHLATHTSRHTTRTRTNRGGMTIHQHTPRGTCAPGTAQYSPLTCTNPRCARPGKHHPHCPGKHCPGCQPRTAATNSRLCAVCTHRLAADAWAAARLWDELALALVPARGARTGPRSATSTGITVDDSAVDARATIRAVLAAWCRLIVDGRMVQAPDGTVRGSATFLARHASWLAAHDAAGDAADELAQLAHGPARAIAYPDGARRVTIAPCPHGGCHGRLYAVVHRADDVLPPRVACTADVAHQWPAAQWRALSRQLAQEAA